MTEQLYRVEQTDGFREQLLALDAFLAGAEAGFAFDRLLDALRRTVIPNLRRFPRMGRRYREAPPQSAEGLAVLAALPAGAADALREYLHGDYLILYADMAAERVVYLVSIRHHRQLTFNFPRT